MDTMTLKMYLLLIGSSDSAGCAVVDPAALLSGTMNWVVSGRAWPEPLTGAGAGAGAKAQPWLQPCTYERAESKMELGTLLLTYWQRRVLLCSPF